MVRTELFQRFFGEMKIILKVFFKKVSSYMRKKENQGKGFHKTNEKRWNPGGYKCEMSGATRRSLMRNRRRH